MNDLFSSPLMQDFKQGKLPTVEVGIEAKSIVTLSLAILIVGVILILGNKLLKEC